MAGSSVVLPSGQGSSRCCITRYYLLRPKLCPRYPIGPLTVLCVCCGDTMDHSRTILKFGVRRERLIFVCPSCQAVDTKELKRMA